jgi:hypothetical protein
MFVDDLPDSAVHYPTERIINDNDLESTGSGQQWRLLDTVRDRIHSRQMKKDIEDPSHPLRTAFADLTPQTSVGNSSKTTPAAQILTIHFTYEVATKELWEYTINGFRTTRKDKVKSTFLKAIDQWPFLRDHQDSFATNNFDSIVSWKNLHEYIDTEPVTRNGTILELWDRDASDGDRTFKLYFKLKHTFDIHNSPATRIREWRTRRKISRMLPDAWT